MDGEIKYLEGKGILDVRSKLKISSCAHIIDDKSIEEDKKNDAVGTTLSGIGPTYSRKALRIGKRVEDLIDKDFKFLGCDVVNSARYLHGKKALFEGAQGFNLDPDWGRYPYVTSSGCTTAQIFTCGISRKSLGKVWGVAKIYETYVGSMEFMPEDQDLYLLQKLGKEYGATTGRPRDCNWLNIDKLIDAILVNDVDVIVFNKCDIIQELEVYKALYKDKLLKFATFVEFRDFINNTLNNEGIDCEIIYSFSAEHL